MSREDVELVRGIYERWAQGDYSGAYREVFDPQVVFARIMPEVPGGAGGAGEWRGIEEMWRAGLDWLRHWEDVRDEGEEFIDFGDRVLVLSRMTARGRQSGVPVETELASIFTLRDGRIVRWELYWDRAVRTTGLEPTASNDLGL
jgi:ketosteroid isomerase-like protein